MKKIQNWNYLKKSVNPRGHNTNWFNEIQKKKLFSSQEFTSFLCTSRSYVTDQALDRIVDLLSLLWIVEDLRFVLFITLCGSFPYSEIWLTRVATDLFSWGRGLGKKFSKKFFLIFFSNFFSKNFPQPQTPEFS